MGNKSNIPCPGCRQLEHIQSDLLCQFVQPSAVHLISAKKIISFQKDNFRFESRHEELVIKHSPTRNLFINFNEFYNNLFSLSEQLLYVVLYFFCLHCPGRLHHLQR